MTANRPDPEDATDEVPDPDGDRAPDAGPGVETVSTVCGCAGKTPLDRVVYPALERIADRAEPEVLLADALDAALLPRTTDLDRDLAAVPLDGSRPHPVGGRSPTWTLAATFAGEVLGANPERFAETVGRTYAALGAVGDAADATAPPAGRVVVGKGHAVQVAGGTTGRQWFEHLRPGGDRRPGYRAANVDVVHAFPGLEPERQAGVAVLNALNDCYASAATTERAVRPLVAVPAETGVSTERVQSWYDAAVPAGVTVHPASVVEHDGRGWLFGATATAAGDRTPPIRTAAVEPGDAVLVHRPLGGLALFSHATDVTERDARRRALAALTADHRPVARALADFLPDPGQRFDPDRHVKLVTDVSGPGVAGVGRALGPGRGLRMTGLPLLDRAALARARDRWVVPDVTVETNGPLAVVAASAVATELADRLAGVGDAAPERLGTVRARGSDAPAVTAADGVPAGRFVERFAGGGEA